MKIFKIICLLTISVFFLSSCNQDKIAELEKENQSLKASAAKKDSSINKMLASFNQIQSNLREIKKREGFIELNASDEDRSSEDIGKIIDEDVKSISNLMKQNQALVQELNRDLNQSQIKIEGFKSIVANLNDRVQSKNKEIASLNEQLKDKKIKIGQLYYSVDSLTFENKAKEEVIEEKIDELNTGYYAIGTFKELRDKNVITKEGGFLGFGKTEDLKDDFNTNYFSKVDIRKQQSFLIYADKAEVVTNHPKGSYEIKGADGKADSLIVTNPEAFWKATKYLVIKVD
ncbi:MAG: hypothetical protein RJQ00_03450 [Vicingaceae bacterium]